MGEYADDEIDKWADWGGGFGRRRWQVYDPPAPPECRECGAICMWMETPQGWRISDDGNSPHECDEDERAAFMGDDMFEDLTKKEGK